MSTFVSVGNATQPFYRLLRSVAAAAHALPQPIVVQHGVARFEAEGIDCRAFVDMTEFERLVAQSQLLILHAGAGSVIHAVRAGKFPIVLPRRAALGELVDDHQVEFADELARVGKIALLRDASDLPRLAALVVARPASYNPTSNRSSLAQMVSDVLQICARTRRS